MKELIQVRVQYASRQQCCKTHKWPFTFYTVTHTSNLCLPLFSVSRMLGAMFCLNARKKCFGNHCCPCHSVFLSCSSGWETRTFSHTHTVTVYSRKMSHTGLEPGLTMNVQWQHMFKISITVEMGLWHWLPFPHSHFHLFNNLWSTTTHYFTGLNSRLLGTEVPSEINETFVSALHWMGFHCHAAGSHLFTEH